MTANSLTFDEIETTTNRALAYAILVSQAAHAYIAAIRTAREMAKALEQLVAVLPSQALARLTRDQKSWLTPRLQEIHKYLADVSRSSETALVSKVPILGNLVKRIQDGTEDLGDIIEDLVLADDIDFRNLIAACERTVVAAEGEPVAKVQG
jgi:hypothetical protein